jgi:hypothetical protein
MTVKKSIENNSYTQPIIGFSWDSYTLWLIAKGIAEDNGPHLAVIQQYGLSSTLQ